MISCRPGELRHKITIQQESVTRSATGAEVKSWSTFATARAKIEPKTGNERWAASQVYAEATGAFTIRYLSGVNPKMRVSWNSRYFDLLPPINTDERNIELIIPYKESV